MQYTVTTIMHFEDEHLALAAEKALQNLKECKLGVMTEAWLAASFGNADTVTTCVTKHTKYHNQTITQDGVPLQSKDNSAK